MDNLPTGTVTFLFTDIEGSTKLWEAYPQQMREALARHDELMREAISATRGYVFKTIGDAFCAVFALASDGVAAAIAAQRAFLVEPWPAETPIRVRMALHTGTVESLEGDYFGPTVNRVSKLLSIGHGGQTLLSQSASELIRNALPDMVHLRDMGERSLKDLGRPENVFQLLHAELPSEFPPLKSLDNFSLKHNLPPQMTNFIGREKEIAAVQSLMTKTRLLTLLGAGGSGKTRLSLQVTADQIDRYEEGVWFIELAPLSDAGLVPQAVASVLGVREQAGKPISQTLVDSLKSKQILLILDNCEHLLETCARLAEALLRQCPQVQILASSREALGVAGEQTYRVPSLLLPDPRKAQTPQAIAHFEAVRLFVDRAALARSDFQITKQNAPALASLCSRLDGIPLALELAAARIRSLSVEEINNKLDQRFRLLTGGSRAALPRQQTLRALVDWSYQMLGELEREAFEQLSVFVGGWSLEMAERLSVDPVSEFDMLDLITALVDKSLVNFEMEEDEWYSYSETIRHFAREQLAARPEVEAMVSLRHAEGMADFARNCVRKFRTSEELSALQNMVRNMPNVAAAFNWAKKQKHLDLVATLALALGATHQRRGYPYDGTVPIDEALAMIADANVLETEVYTRLLCERATLALDLLENDTAEPLAERARQLAQQLGTKELLIRAENLLGQVAMDRQDFVLSRQHYNEALRLSEETHNWIETARLLNNLGIVERRDPEGDKELAAQHYRSALTVQRSQNHSRGEAETLNSLGVLEQSRGNLDEAATLYLQAAEIETQLDHPFGVAKTLSNYGEVMVERGESKKALWPLGIAEQLFCRIRSPYSEYTGEMLTRIATGLGWTDPHLEDFRGDCARVTLDEAVNASRQAE